jgi:hypothetical protein
VQEDVHDFAWTTSPTTPDDESSASRVCRRLKCAFRRSPSTPDRKDGISRRRAPRLYYGTWFGSYDHITVVDP